LGNGQQPDTPASSRHERYRVTEFGSARTEPGHWVYEEVKQMCSALSAMNCDIVTGGGPGLMQAANEGALAAQASQGVQSIGIRVHLPFEQDVNPFVEQAFEQCDLLHSTSPLRARLRRLHRCPGWPRNPARNDDDLAALAGASPARHAPHFHGTHVEGPS
jgi:predicted Rossmann-fold nucleotide-binding protein